MDDLKAFTRKNLREKSSIKLAWKEGEEWEEAVKGDVQVTAYQEGSDESMLKKWMEAIEVTGGQGIMQNFIWLHPEFSLYRFEKVIDENALIIYLKTEEEPGDLPGDLFVEPDDQVDSDD